MLDKRHLTCRLHVLTLLSGLHTTNSWQTYHVGKLLATNRTCLCSRLLFHQPFRVGNSYLTCVGKWSCQLLTCLPTVVVSFTHANLSLPTRVCQLNLCEGRLRPTNVKPRLHVLTLTMLERVAGILDDVCLHFLLEECFDFDQTSFLTKNVRQTSSNMPASRSNIVEPTNVI